MLWAGAVAAALDPVVKCQAYKVKVGGKLAQCLANEHAKQLKRKPFDTQKCYDKFDKAIARADKKAAKKGVACEYVAPQCQVDLIQLQDDLATCNADLAANLPEPNSLFPASGQTTVNQADKNDGIIGSVNVPDDGTVQAGAPLSYTDNADGTITDNNTGLMWEKKGNLNGFLDFNNLHDADNSYIWSGDGSQETIWDWLDDVNAEGGVGFAGYDDWRIPNAKELQSIVDYERFGPSIDPIFGPTVMSLYWSSTSNTFISVNAWYVNFFIGDVNFDDKNGDSHVRAVRGGL